MASLLSEKLKSIRKSKGLSLTEVAGATRLDKAYLSKVESGSRNPSNSFLNSLVSYYSLPTNELLEIYRLAGHKSPIIMNERKEVINMEQKIAENQPGPGVQVNVPANLPILYTDSIWATASQYGIVLDFAQGMGPTNSQNVVARVGLSYDHAKELVKLLSKKLEEVRKIEQEKEKNKN